MTRVLLLSCVLLMACDNPCDDVTPFLNLDGEVDARSGAPPDEIPLRLGVTISKPTGEETDDGSGGVYCDFHTIVDAPVTVSVDGQAPIEFALNPDGRGNTRFAGTVTYGESVTVNVEGNIRFVGEVALPTRYMVSAAAVTNGVNVTWDSGDELPLSSVWIARVGEA